MFQMQRKYVRLWKRDTTYKASVGNYSPCPKNEKDSSEAATIYGKALLKSAFWSAATETRS